MAAQDAVHPPVCPASVLCEVSEETPDGGGGGGVDGGRLHARCRLLACATPHEVDRHPAAAQSVRIARPDCILIPGLVNAHSHLDLTHIGARPHDPGRGFSAFVEVVRDGRRQLDHEIAGSVRLGVDLSLAGGVVAVGDIAGAPLGRPSLAPWRELRASPLRGVSFLEFFAIGTGLERGLERIAAALSEADAEGPGAGGGVGLALQPHAPYTVALRAYEWVVEHARTLAATHLAETPDERAFVARGTGPQREFLESLGLWERSILNDVGHGKTPVQYVGSILKRHTFLAAHINDASDDDIEVLAKTGTHVAYCPRASDYFGAHHHFGPHRYRDMLGGGVNVCLGTDSIINLPADSVHGAEARISVLDEMRFLYQRDRTDPATLLAMATVHGAKALSLEPREFSFEQGVDLAGLVAVAGEGSTSLGGRSPLHHVVSGTGRLEIMVVGKQGERRAPSPATP